MDNAHYKNTCERIETMSIEELKSFIEHLTESEQDTWPDDDLAGDIAVTNWKQLAQERLHKLEKEDSKDGD